MNNCSSYHVIKLMETKYSAFAQVSTFDLKEEAEVYCREVSIIEQTNNYKDRGFSLKIEKEGNIVKFVVKKHNKFHAKITYIMAIN